jgi:protein tyrosine phosphatase (PTP) superfamily phosphohydrolase (DUF442 family)
MITVKKIQDVNGVNKIIKVGNFYISSQPEINAFEWIKKEGISEVINLRDNDEANFEAEEKTCKDIGLGYHQFPVTANGHFLLDNVSTLNSIVDKKDQNYFIHCVSGNRVLAWLLLYFPNQKVLNYEETEKLVLDLGFSSDSLLSEARKLNNAELN